MFSKQPMLAWHLPSKARLQACPASCYLWKVKLPGADGVSGGLGDQRPWAILTPAEVAAVSL